MFALSRRVWSLVVLEAIGVALLAPSLAGAQDAPPAPPAVDPELVRRLEKRIADLEARAAAEKKPEEKKPEEKKPEPPKAAEPFAFGDFSWSPANYAPSDHALAWGPFTGELRVDVAYHYSLANPKDHTISGSSEVFRSNEFQLAQFGFGGDFLYKGVQARLMTQFGMYSTTTPRNDASPGLGQWNLDNAYRYLAEAYGGYHFDVLNGINIQAGIFMSYVGLWSYYNFDNWTYQPSYVSSNTPWFFNGMRIQIFATDKLKFEPWLVNGWQSYGKFNEAPGVGLQILWKPTEYLTILGNQYFGTDTLGTPGRKRIHTDDSIMARFYNNPGGAFSKFAMSLTLDAGCEFGPGSLDASGKPTGVTGFGAGPVSCGGGTSSSPDQYFLGFMSYARAWFAGDKIGVTVGGGAITNPGRYLVLLPPINGATAFTGTPYFSEAPNVNGSNQFQAWDMQATVDYMPTQNITWRLEYNHRAASVPYFSGPNGVTPPGGNTGTPGVAVMGWSPDLVNSEDRLTAAMLVRY
jgi:hypothetical protein